MKVYVAGRFTEKLRVSGVMDALRADGHEVTSDWTTEEDHPKNYAPNLSPEIGRQFYLQECADKCINGVMECDVLLALNNPTAAGMFVEVGLAIGYGKKIIVVDPQIRDTPFWYLQGVTHVESDDEALYEINMYDDGTEISASTAFETQDTDDGEWTGND